jgi:hypothetical protein
MESYVSIAACGATALVLALHPCRPCRPRQSVVAGPISATRWLHVRSLFERSGRLKGDSAATFRPAVKDASVTFERFTVKGDRAAQDLRLRARWAAGDNSG